ncbi:MAG TPA: hypothetical protein PLD84_00670 [Chitinophagales bacterium]|nr:hypothetical protein [Chitinophagales bacterium]
MTGNKSRLKEIIVKIYREKDAPKGAIFLSKMIERNGILDLAVSNYKIPKLNEKIVVIY